MLCRYESVENCWWEIGCTTSKTITYSWIIFDFSIHYSPNFKHDGEVKRGFSNCLTKMVFAKDEIHKIDIQLIMFKDVS